jgi:hypothetical protein
MAGALLRIDGTAAVERVWEDAARQYIDERRARVAAFIDNTYSFEGALAVHKSAVGWDLVRAPVNVALGVPTVAARLAGLGLRRLGRTGLADRFDDTHFFLETDVDREIRWRLHSGLLELPLRQPGRAYDGDALSAAVLAQPAIAGALNEISQLVATRAADPAFRARLDRNLDRYVGSRTAAAELATVAFSSAAGVLMFHQVTPSAISLGPAIAAAVAHHAAVATFPLGVGAGALWHGAFPAAPSALLVAGTTGTLVAGVAGLSAFAGVATDPLQRRLGVHRRRLHRLIDSLEADLVEGRASRLAIRSHYLARLIDLLDFLRTVYAAAR